MKFNFKEYKRGYPSNSFIGITNLSNNISVSRQAIPFLGDNEFVTIEFDRENKAIKLTPNNDTGTSIKYGVATRIHVRIPDMPQGRYIQSEEDESIFIYQEKTN